MEEQFLRRREVEKITGLSYSSIYRLMPKGQFPRQVRVGLRSVRWRATEVFAWMKSRPWA